MSTVPASPRSLPATPLGSSLGAHPATDRAPEPTGVYARVSSLAQGEDWKTSLATQVAESERFAPTAGLVVDPACVAREPYTATTMHRPALDRLLETMAAKGVRHLILDKADRVTREGQVVAAVFLQNLLDHGITLHLALERLTLDNDTTVMVFLTMAFGAKKDNEYRVANVQRNRQAAARQLGRYARGRHAPYGWRYAPRETDARGHTLSYHLVHDPATFPTLERILAAALRGEGEWKIAKDLSRDALPTPDEAAGQGKGRQAMARGQKLTWRPQTVRRLIDNPVNAGLVASFRTRRTVQPPDDKHPRRWYKNVPVPAAEQILLPSNVVVDPPLTWEQYQRLVSPGPRQRERTAQAHRYDRQPQPQPRGSDTVSSTLDDADDRPRSPTPPTPPALLAGGLLTHADCGGRLRVKRTRRGDHLYQYYACKRHEDVPSACPAGLHVAVADVDDLLWAAMRHVLLTPGRLEQLAVAQRQADLAALSRDEGPTSQRHLERVRADLLAQRAHLADMIATTQSAFVRATLEEKLIKLEPDLAEADERLAELRAVADDEERRRAVLADVRQQLGRYVFLLEVLDAFPREDRVPIQRRILRALGFGGTLRVDPLPGRDPTGGQAKRMVVEAELRLADGVATEPWLERADAPQMQRGSEMYATLLPRIRAAHADHQRFLADWAAEAAAEGRPLLPHRDTPLATVATVDEQPDETGETGTEMETETVREVYTSAAGQVAFVVPSAHSSR